MWVPLGNDIVLDYTGLGFTWGSDMSVSVDGFSTLIVNGKIDKGNGDGISFYGDGTLIKTFASTNQPVVFDADIKRYNTLRLNIGPAHFTGVIKITP